jgi:hypothetical protein
MEHTLQLKQSVKETEELKVEKYKQTKILKEKNNFQDHKQNLQMIEFTTKTRQKGKENDLTRR